MILQPSAPGVKTRPREAAKREGIGAGAGPGYGPPVWQSEQLRS